MPKIIIENYVVDLTQIVSVSLPNDHYYNGHYCGFKINLTGGSYITVLRHYKDIDIFPLWEGDSVEVIEHNKKRDKQIEEFNKSFLPAKEKVEKMYAELMKRWSPDMLEIENITIL